MNDTRRHSGPGYLWQGFRLIARPGLRRYVAVPLLINMLLFAALIGYGASEFNTFIDNSLPAWLDWLEWLLWPLFALTVLVAAFYTFSLLANLIAAPFNSLLAAAVERQLRGEVAPANGRGLLREAAASFAQEFKKFLFLIGWSAPLLILFLIPGLNLAAPAAWFAFSAWMLALEYSDYPMSNHGLGFSEIRQRLRQRPLRNLSFGAGTLLCTTIPVLNFFVMPAAVAGATLMWSEELDRERGGSVTPQR